MQREWIFRDQTSFGKVWDNVKPNSRFRFRRHEIFQLTDELKETIKVLNWKSSLVSVAQVCLALQFLWVCVPPSCEWWKVYQTTACRVIYQITGSLLQCLFGEAAFKSLLLFLRFSTLSSETAVHLSWSGSLDKIFGLFLPSGRESKAAALTPVQVVGLTRML